MRQSWQLPSPPIWLPPSLCLQLREGPQGTRLPAGPASLSVDHAEGVLPGAQTWSGGHFGARVPSTSSWCALCLAAKLGQGEDPLCRQVQQFRSEDGHAEPGGHLSQACGSDPELPAVP